MGLLLSRAGQTMLTGALGLTVFGLFMMLISRSAPTSLVQQISREKNPATAVLFAGFALGIATVIASTLRSS